MCTNNNQDQDVAVFDFSEALLKLKKGEKVTNLDWDSTKMFLEMQKRDKNSKMTTSYIYFNLSCKGEKDGYTKMPYWPSPLDLFSERWSIVKFT